MVAQCAYDKKILLPFNFLYDSVREKKLSLDLELSPSSRSGTFSIHALVLCALMTHSYKRNPVC